MRSIGWVIGVGGLLLFVGACGDDDGAQGESCEFVQACGGDVVGRWEFVGACVHGVEGLASQSGLPEPSCTGAIRRGDLHVTGMLEFAGGQLTTDVVSQVETELRLTRECLLAVRGTPSVDVPAVCGDLEQGYRSGDFESASCHVIGTSCNCVVMSLPEHELTTEPYTATGGVISSGTEAVSYCVQGNTLRIMNGDANQFSVITARKL